ncbi:MAG: hypothetical protein KAV83_11860 [Desulfobacterales bacterium]|nr:hypothetical protein [Desulfobacterales bacterium]
MLAPYVGADEWQQVTGVMPQARYGHQMVNIAGNAYIFGGAAQLSVRCPLANDIWKYSPDEDMWEEISPNDPPGGKIAYSVITYSDKMYTVFGQNPDSMSSELWTYEPWPRTWEEPPQGLTKPTARAYHTTVVSGDKMLLFGGSPQPLNGDLDNNGTIDICDAIIALQVISGMKSLSAINLQPDINNDGKVSLEEAIYVLQVLSGLRNP